MVYRTKIPAEVYQTAQKTGEVQHWIDDRGYLFAVTWSEEHNTNLAACVGLPPDGDPSKAWNRDTPQPDQVMVH